MGLGGFIGEMKRIWNYAGSIGYIAGDDTALHGRADTWRAMADELRSARDQLDHIAATQLRGGEGGNWNDPASDAFRAAWSREAAHFGELASQYDAMAKALHDAGHEGTNFNHATKMVLLEIGAWIAVTVALAAIPGADLAEEGIAAARAAMLISRWGRLAIWIIRLWSSARKWFAINLLILYGSRFAERWIKLGDPTKGWTKNDAVQLTTSAAVASVLGGALALPGAMLRSSRLAVLAEDLAGGRLAAGTPLVKGSAAAAQVAPAGFRARVPLLLRGVPGIDGAMGVGDEGPTLRTVSDARTAGGRPGVGSLFRIEPENRLLASPKLLPALF